MICKNCKAELCVDEWNGWRWTCPQCSNIGRLASVAEIKKLERGREMKKIAEKKPETLDIGQKVNELMDLHHKNYALFSKRCADDEKNRLTIRDHFAMSAMNAIVAANLRGGESYLIQAILSYTMADAMLEARKK